MPIKTQIWTVNGQPHQLKKCMLPSEQLLEDMIVTTAAAVLNTKAAMLGVIAALLNALYFWIGTLSSSKE